MKLSDDIITELFCQVDTFCNHFQHALAPHILESPPKKKPKLSVSEVITLMVLFHHNGYRTMKRFYLDYIKIHMCYLFPNTVS